MLPSSTARSIGGTAGDFDVLDGPACAVSFCWSAASPPASGTLSSGLGLTSRSNLCTALTALHSSYSSSSLGGIRSLGPPSLVASARPRSGRWCRVRYGEAAPPPGAGTAERRVRLWVVGAGVEAISGKPLELAGLLLLVACVLWRPPRGRFRGGMLAEEGDRGVQSTSLRLRRVKTKSFACMNAVVFGSAATATRDCYRHVRED